MAGPSATNLLERLFHHTASRPEAPAFRAAGVQLTYGMLADQVTTLTAILRSELQPRAVVIVSGCNQLAYPVAFLGVLAAGCTLFPISADAGDAELMLAVRESGAIAAIGDARAIRILGPVLQKVIPIQQLLRQSIIPADRPALKLGDLLLQSSGTTGLPKIACRSGDSLSIVARSMAETVPFGPDDRVLMSVPLSHSYGLEHGLLAPIWAGSCVHLCRGLDLPAVSSELAGGGITLLPGVPSIFEMLGNVTAPRITMPTLRTAYSAGGPLPRAVFDTFLRRFGMRITQLYGASEIGSVTFNPLGNPPSDGFDPASVGLPFDDVSIRILDPDTNAPLPMGDVGQVAILAPGMFSGYLGASAHLIDGHFPTGDLGRVDATGRLFVTGRIKLVIDVGGLKVNPLEVEAVLGEHPDVAACLVTGVRQSQTMFRLKALVVPRDPTTPPAVAELRRFAKSRLSAYKVPRLFEIRDSLPSTANGKVLRHLVETA